MYGIHGKDLTVKENLREEDRWTLIVCDMPYRAGAGLRSTLDVVSPERSTELAFSETGGEWKAIVEITEKCIW